MTNKELVLEFYDKVFNAHDLSDLGLHARGLRAAQSRGR